MPVKSKKVVDDTHRISKKRGNGLLRREIWVEEEGKVSRYNLAYINHNLYPGDNGRVFGHSGSSTGWGSRLYIYPDRGVAAAAIVNLQGGGGAATRLARGLAELAIEMKRE